MTQQRGNHNVVTVSMRDMWQHFQREHGIYINELLYSRICRAFNEEVVKLIIFKNYEFIFPFGMGSLSVRKYKPKKLKFDDNGNLIKIDLPVDFNKTNKLWARDPEAKAKKKFILFTNEHTNGDLFRFNWNRRDKRYKNKLVYSFKVLKKHRRLLSLALLDDNFNVDYHKQ